MMRGAAEIAASRDTTAGAEAGGVAPGMRIGIAVGVVSALFVALFGSLNKRFAGHHDPLAVTALELGAGIALLTVLAPLMPLLFPAFAGNPFALPGARDLGRLREAACRRLRADLDDMAAALQCVDGRLRLAVLDHDHAGPRGARPERDQ